MKHDEAIAAVAAERYILGELSEAERQDFEEHFFDCPQCSADVRDLARLTGGVKVILGHPAKVKQDEPKVQRSFSPLDAIRGWLGRPAAGWVAACAMLLLSVGSRLQTGTVAQLRPQAAQSYILYPDTRGEPVTIPSASTGSLLLLEFDVPGAAGTLDWSVLSATSNRVVEGGAVAAPPPGSSLKLILPGETLNPAEYRLDVRRQGESANTWSFRFRVTGAQ